MLSMSPTLLLNNYRLVLRATIKLKPRCFSTDMKEQQVVINNQTINYIKVGNGKKNVLCFPGAIGSIWSDFKPQVEKLDREAFTVIAWDPPGYGYSRPPDRKATPEFYETDAVAAHQFLNAINVYNYSLLGWSDGGISSMIMAAKYPESVEKLIIWGSNSYVLPSEIEIYENIRDINKWSERMRAPLVALYGAELFQRMWNEWIDALLEIHQRGGDICSKLIPLIKCPTLILHGAKDPMVAPEHHTYLHEKIKNSKLHVFPDGKHNVHLKYADEFNKIVTDFLLADSKTKL